MHYPMNPINPQEYRYPDIRGQKRTRREPAREEDIEAVDKGQECEGEHGDPCADGLQEGVVGDRGWGEVLDDGGASEADVDDAAADPGDEAGGVG